MLSDSEQAYFRDILASIANIQEFIAGYTYEDYLRDLKTRSAVERQVLIIAEAAGRLGETAERLCPAIPWHNIRGVGDRIRHAYDYVDSELMWEGALQSLPALKGAVEAALTAD